MLIGLNTSARAGVTWRSSAETLNPSTVMSGTETVHAGADVGALGAGAAADALAPAGVPLGAEVGTEADRPPAPAGAHALGAGAPAAAVDAPPPAGVVNSSRFNCPCALSQAFTSPPVRL